MPIYTPYTYYAPNIKPINSVLRPNAFVRVNSPKKDSPKKPSPKKPSPEKLSPKEEKQKVLQPIKSPLLLA